MSTEIGAYEAKSKLPEILRRVEAGERFTVTNRGVPVADITPTSTASKANAKLAVQAMKAMPKIKGVSTAMLRAMIAEGRR